MELTIAVPYRSDENASGLIVGASERPYHHQVRLIVFLYHPIPTTSTLQSPR